MEATRTSPLHVDGSASGGQQGCDDDDSDLVDQSVKRWKKRRVHTVVTAPFGGIATGTVTFYDGTTTLGTVHERGEGESHNFKTEPRTHHVTATYDSSATLPAVQAH